MSDVASSPSSPVAAGVPDSPATTPLARKDVWRLPQDQLRLGLPMIEAQHFLLDTGKPVNDREAHDCFRKAR